MGRPSDCFCGGATSSGGGATGVNGVPKQGGSGVVIISYPA